MNTRLYWDSDPRSQHWTQIDFEDLWPVYNDSSDAPRCFILIHTKDLEGYLDDVFNRRWESPQQVCDALRSRFGKETAILYISGGGQAWNRFANTFSQPPIDDSLQHVLKARIHDGERDFALRLKRCVERFQSSQDAVPDWMLLDRGWRDEAREFASAVCLLDNDAGLREFLVRVRSDVVPFSESEMRWAKSQGQLYGDEHSAAEAVQREFSNAYRNGTDLATLRGACKTFLVECA